MLKLMVYKVGLIKVENNVRRRERCASPIIDDVFNEMGDENYNSASLGYGDQFEHSRNRRYKWVMRDGQFNQEYDSGNLGTVIG